MFQDYVFMLSVLLLLTVLSSCASNRKFQPVTIKGQQDKRTPQMERKYNDVKNFQSLHDKGSLNW